MRDVVLTAWFPLGQSAGKSDYSNQLITFTDEWELEPHSLKFSSLLGQGAFGKVVTGYYEDVKVAIKLVRGE